jgi:hypothetical protein
MGRKEIIIDIDEQGNCVIDAKNFVGGECEQYIKEIETALGIRTSSNKKPEYQQRVAVRGRNTQQTGR